MEKLSPILFSYAFDENGVASKVNVPASHLEAESVPVIVGVALTVLPVEELKLVAGDQEYVLAPLAVNTSAFPFLISLKHKTGKLFCRAITEFAIVLAVFKLHAEVFSELSKIERIVFCLSVFTLTSL